MELEKGSLSQERKIESFNNVKSSLKSMTNVTSYTQKFCKINLTSADCLQIDLVLLPQASRDNAESDREASGPGLGTCQFFLN